VAEADTPQAYGYCSAGHWTTFPAADVDRVRAARPRCPSCGTRHFAACPKCGALITSEATYDCRCGQHFPPRVGLERLVFEAA
jgi:hypothetical protein